MKFDGRIIKVLPVRSGVSQNGSEWKVLPFVFAYKENADDRWEDRVLLETMDRNHMVEIAKYCVTADGKVVVEDDHVKLRTEDIKCRVGFSHGVREITSKDGRKSTINNMRVYELTIGESQHQPQPVQAAPQQPAIPAPAAAPLPTNPSDDDLPF